MVTKITLAIKIVHLRVLDIRLLWSPQFYKNHKFVGEEDKIWDKVWRAQQAHVHGPKEGRAHSLCGALDRTKAQTCPPRFRFLKTCSARKGLGLQGQDLSYKEKTCSTRRRLALQEEDLLCKDKTCFTRRRLALQGKKERPRYYKGPNILLT